MKEGTIKSVHASPTPRVEIWGEETIDLTAFLQSKGLGLTNYTVYAASGISIGYTNAVVETANAKVYSFGLDEVKAFRMKQKERIMALEGQNVLDCLALLKEKDTYYAVGDAINKINAFKAAKQPFAIIFQGAAGADITGFKDPWMQAGLGGCTAELARIHVLLPQFNVIIINTLKPEQQILANTTVTGKTKIEDSGKNIINDPEKHFFKLLNMEDNVDLVHIVGLEGDQHDAYKPQALICDEDSVIQSVIKNNNFTPGQPRESEDYVRQVKDALVKLTPTNEHVPLSYIALRASQAEAAAARRVGTGAGAKPF